MHDIERRVGRESRAMTRREVITKAITKQLSWVQASEILGISVRHMRRLRRKLERWGMSAVMDQRGGRPRQAASGIRCRRVLADAIPISVYMTTVVTLKEIQLRDAKATLSAVIDDAVRGAPCVITRHGRREAVLIAYQEWERLSRVPSFGRLLMAAPLEEGDLPRRNRKPLRRTRP